MQELKSVKMVKFVGLFITFIAKLGEGFQALVKQAEEVISKVDDDDDKKKVEGLIDGLVLAAEAAIVLLEVHASVASDARKEELMQGAWKIRLVADAFTSLKRTASEGGELQTEEIMQLVHKLQKMTSPENIGRVKTVKMEAN